MALSIQDGPCSVAAQLLSSHAQLLLSCCLIMLSCCFRSGKEIISVGWVERSVAQHPAPLGEA
jgi:hypothetical protein